MKPRKIVPSLLKTLGVPLLCRIAQKRYQRLGESWDAGCTQGKELTLWLRKYVAHVGHYSHVQILVGSELFDKLLREEARGMSTFRDRQPVGGQLQFRGIPITLYSLLGDNQVQMARL